MRVASGWHPDHIGQPADEVFPAVFIRRPASHVRLHSRLPLPTASPVAGGKFMGNLCVTCNHAHTPPGCAA